ncbi:hypothetical protein Aduo_018503 [Ancylostoma duodenale]
MYDGFSCAKPSAYFVILQENVADISRASLDKPINFDSLGVINITNGAPTTADIDQRMPLSGDASGGVDIIGDLGSIRSIAIDFRKDLLYWTELDASAHKHFTFDQHALVCRAPDNIVVAGNDHGFIVMNLRLIAGQVLSYKEDPMVEFTLPNVGIPHSVAVDTSSRLIFWIDAKDQSVIKFSRLIFPAETSVLRNACNCSIFHSLAVDENARVLYVSCQSLTGVGYVYVFRIKDASSIPLELIGMVVSGSEISLATGHLPAPRDITILPYSNYLFYVDVSPFLPSPAIIQCQLDGRKCEAWLSKDLWPGTRIHADGTYLRLFYTVNCKST